MVNDTVRAGHLGGELHHRRPTSRYVRRLDVGFRLAGQRSLREDPVENGANDVEARGEIRSTIAEEDADCLAHVRVESIVARERANGTVEQDVVRSLVEHLVQVKCAQTRVTTLAL